MQEKQNQERECNTIVQVSGILEKDFEFSHYVYGEKFYKNRIKVRRLSGVEDYIPIIVSKLLIGDNLYVPFSGYVKVKGSFRSYNRYGDDAKNHLEIFLFATSIDFCETKEEHEEYLNQNIIYLRGFICKKPIRRQTPLGREITDCLVAVNRPYNKSDYIPCIVWGRKSLFASNLEIGDEIELYGRIQSREYLKEVSPYSNETEKRVTYEVSVNELTKIG